MKKIITLIFVALVCVASFGQKSAQKKSPTEECSILKINRMDDGRQKIINNSSAKYGETKGLGENIATAGIAAVVDVALTEFIKLITLYGEQKKEWRKMIENECLYKNEIGCIYDINDFYSATSRNGSMDPSDFAFDGVTILDSIGDEEVLRAVCSVDLSGDKLETLWNHGTFSLVLDTFYFKPFKAHLPNLKANGIKDTTGSKRDNTFSFNERMFYCVSLNMKLSSSWVNQAAMVMRDVQLGSFQITIKIDSQQQLDSNYVYRYVRGESDKEIAVSGSSFIVPRSFIVTPDARQLWGTGAFRISAEVTETSGFDFNKKSSERADKWLTDYYRIRRMQKSSAQRFTDYIVTLLRQNAGVVVKKTASTAVNGAVQSGITTKTTAAQSGNAGGAAQR